MIRRRETHRPKGWFEEWLDFSFPEKLITIMWCGMPYLLWMMAEGLGVIYKVPVVIAVWILLTLLCYLFGHFMSSEDRDWNRY